jgi:hypothetical protein
MPAYYSLFAKENTHDEQSIVFSFLGESVCHRICSADGVEHSRSIVSDVRVFFNQDPVRQLG